MPKVSSLKKHRLNNTGILNQDTGIINGASAEHWWHEIERSSLDNTKQLSSLRTKRSSIPINELDNSSIRGQLSAEIVKNNILETTSESEEEMGIKKKKAPLMLQNRRSTQNHFLDILNLKRNTSWHEATDMSRASKNLSSNKISLQKLQEKEMLQKEDSEDSISNIVPLKSRPQLLRRKSEKGSNEILKKLIDIMNRSEDNAETLNKFGLEKSDKRYTNSLNLSNKSSVKAQHSNVERNVTSDSTTSEDNRDLFRKKRPTLQSLVAQRMEEKKNPFKAAFGDNSDVSLSRSKDIIQEVGIQSMIRDVEHQTPRSPSSSHSEIVVNDDNILRSRISADVRMNTDELGSDETVIDDSLDKTTKKSDRSASVKRTSGQNFHKEAHLSRSKSATPKSTSDVSAILSRQSARLNNSIVDPNNSILKPEVRMSNARRMGSSISNLKNTSVSERTSKTIDKSTELEEMVAVDKIKYTTLVSQTSRQNSLSLEDRTNNKITLRTSARLSTAHNESNVKETQNTSVKQSSFTKPQSQRNTPVKVSNKGNISKTNAPNRTMEDFFQVRHSLANKKQATSNNPTAVSEIFKDAKKMEQIKERLEIIKSRELAEMKMHADEINKKQLALDMKAALSGTVKRKKVLAAKKVDPAYLVDGKVYKAPKLLRPKQWATNRLYNFLWKCMETKYGFSTRVRSEKFILELSNIITLIMRRKKYDNYKTELKALMKEMARLKIINTRNDFYNFCHDFMPYEFRVKVIPILLPGNQRTIPYDPDKLHTPLLDE